MPNSRWAFDPYIYQATKAHPEQGQYEHLKRKTLLAPDAMSAAAGSGINQKFGQNGAQQDERVPSRGGQSSMAGFENRGGGGAGGAGLAGFAFGALNNVVNGMESGVSV